MAEISINLRADPSQFEAGTKAAEKAVDDWVEASEDGAGDVAKKLEEVIRALVKLGTQSGKTKNEMVDDLRKFGLSAEDAEDAVEAVWKEMDEGKRAAAGVDKASESFDGMQDAAGKTGDKLRDLGDIARDVLEGDFGGAAESAIGALSAIGLFAGVGGALAGSLLAGVAELAGGWVTEWTRAAEEVKASIAEAYKQAAEDGRAFIDEAQIQKGVFDIMFDTDKENIYQQAQRDAEILGVTLDDVLRAQAGDEEKILMIREAGLQRVRDSIDPETQRSDLSATTLATIGHTVEKYDALKAQQEEYNARAERAIGIEQQMGVEASRNQGKALAAIDVRGAALQAYADRAASIPDPVLVPKLDTSNVFAEMEALRQRKWSISVGIDAVVNQRRGSFTI